MCVDQWFPSTSTPPRLYPSKHVHATYARVIYIKYMHGPYSQLFSFCWFVSLMTFVNVRYGIWVSEWRHFDLYMYTYVYSLYRNRKIVIQSLTYIRQFIGKNCVYCLCFCSHAIYCESYIDNATDSYVYDVMHRSLLVLALLFGVGNAVFVACRFRCRSPLSLLLLLLLVLLCIRIKQFLHSYFCMIAWKQGSVRSRFTQKRRNIHANVQ